MGGPRSGGEDSSSEEEEEDLKLKAAIESISATTVFSTANGSSKSAAEKKLAGIGAARYDGDDQFKPKKLTHAQIKMQKILDEMVENNLDFVKDSIDVTDVKPENDCGVRLFKKSPIGIVFDRVEELQGPTKKPKILPGNGTDVNSKSFKKQLKSVAVEGLEILAAAKEASKKSLARLEAKEAEAKAKAKKEEERVMELKKTRGEKWLPSIARERLVR